MTAIARPMSLIGRPMSLLIQRHDLLQRQPGSWLQRRAHVGGLLHQSSVHELDWLRTLLGEVAEVFARAAPATIQAGLDFPDAIEVNLRFQSGCIATLSACMTSYVWQHEGSIQGAAGSLAWSLSEGTLRWQGSRQAVDEYLAKQGLQVLMHRLDYTARLIVKP
jgi:predicted dehydrogenase